jgi:hypothetical protein
LRPVVSPRPASFARWFLNAQCPDFAMCSLLDD